MVPWFTVEQVFGTRSRVRVLRVLDHASTPLNASQLARRTGLSQPAVATALEELGRMGLVGSSSAGRANVHWIVRDNVWVERFVSPAFGFELGVSSMIEEELRTLFSTACSVVFFGSHARSEGREGSDIDVVVVVEDRDAKRELEELLPEIEAAFGRRWGAPLSVMTYDVHEGASLSDRAPAFYGSLVEEGVTLLGPLPFEWKGTWGIDTQ